MILIDSVCVCVRLRACAGARAHVCVCVCVPEVSTNLSENFTRFKFIQSQSIL
jgi:hypothetical protein